MCVCVFVCLDVYVQACSQIFLGLLCMCCVCVVCVFARVRAWSMSVSICLCMRLLNVCTCEHMYLSGKHACDVFMHVFSYVLAIECSPGVYAANMPD